MPELDPIRPEGPYCLKHPRLWCRCRPETRAQSRLGEALVSLGTASRVGGILQNHIENFHFLIPQIFLVFYYKFISIWNFC